MPKTAITKKISTASRSKKVTSKLATTDAPTTDEVALKQMSAYTRDVIKAVDWVADGGRPRQPGEKTKVVTEWALGIYHLLSAPEGTFVDVEVRDRLVQAFDCDDDDAPALDNAEVFDSRDPLFEDALGKNRVDEEEIPGIVRMWTHGLELAQAFLEASPGIPLKYLGHLAVFAGAARAGFNASDFGALIEKLHEIDGSEEEKERSQERAMKSAIAAFGSRDAFIQACKDEAAAGKGSGKSKTKKAAAKAADDDEEDADSSAEDTDG
jgi:hypothetical protein